MRCMHAGEGEEEGMVSGQRRLSSPPHPFSPPRLSLFFLQDILQYSEFRVEVLGNVWRAFLFIAESALKVSTTEA